MKLQVPLPKWWSLEEGWTTFRASVLEGPRLLNPLTLCQSHSGEGVGTMVDAKLSLAWEYVTGSNFSLVRCGKTQLRKTRLLGLSGLFPHCSLQSGLPSIHILHPCCYSPSLPPPCIFYCCLHPQQWLNTIAHLGDTRRHSTLSHPHGLWTPKHCKTSQNMFIVPLCPVNFPMDLPHCQERGLPS